MTGTRVATLPRLRIAVLASGHGSNLQALIDAHDSGRLPIDLVAVGSNRPACEALARAGRAGIARIALDPRDFHDRATFDNALFDAISGHAPDLVVLAGFMRILDDRAVAAAPWPMINIHPSLLPKYPGLDTHARALAAGDAEHGASVHVVIPALDAGPVIAHARIAVQSGDSPESLARRLLPREHALLIACVSSVAQRRIILSPAGIQFDGGTLRVPLLLGDDDELHHSAFNATA